MSYPCIVQSTDCPASFLGFSAIAEHDVLEKHFHDNMEEFNITFHVEDNIIYSLKRMLTESPVLYDQIKYVTICYITDIRYVIFEIFLKYLVTKRISLHHSNFIEILTLARTYKVKSLERICTFAAPSYSPNIRLKLSSEISVENNNPGIYLSLLDSHIIHPYKENALAFMLNIIKWTNEDSIVRLITCVNIFCNNNPLLPKQKKEITNMLFGKLMGIKKYKSKLLEKMVESELFTLTQIRTISMLPCQMTKSNSNHDFQLIRQPKGNKLHLIYVEKPYINYNML